MSSTSIRRSARISSLLKQTKNPIYRSDPPVSASPQVPQVPSTPQKVSKPLIPPPAPIKTPLDPVIVREVKALLNEFSAIPVCKETYLKRIRHATKIMKFVYDHPNILNIPKLSDTILGRIDHFRHNLEACPYETETMQLNKMVIDITKLYLTIVTYTTIDDSESIIRQLIALTKQQMDKIIYLRDQFRGMYLLEECAKVERLICAKKFGNATNCLACADSAIAPKTM